jgi:hypothetical protein
VPAGNQQQQALFAAQLSDFLVLLIDQDFFPDHRRTGNHRLS